MLASRLFEKRATAIGRYWRSAVSSPALRHYLRGTATTYFKAAGDNRRFWETDQELRQFLRNFDFEKTADLGGEQENNFEQAFSSLAYNYIKDKAPRLLDFIVGFQLVDRNEDNTKAMGIFGFKVGDQWLYVPVFFLNGDLKGHEMIYIKDRDAFVPLKENWINHIISRRPHILGEGSERNTFELGGLMPNLSRLAKPPTGTKYGSDRGRIDMSEWAKPMLPVIGALASAKATGLYPTLKKASDLDIKAIAGRPAAAALAEFSGAFDLRQFLQPFPMLKIAFEKFYQSYPLIKQGFDTFYGPDFFRQMAEAAKDRLKKAETEILPENPDGSRPVEDKRSPTMDEILAREAAEAKSAELTIIALDVDPDKTITENKPELDDEERQRLLRDTVLIKDKRDPHATTMVVNTQHRMKLFNPDESAIYEILEKPGTFDDMVVIHHPHTGRGREDFCLVLRKSAPRNWMNIHRTHLWSRSSDEPFVRQRFVDYVEDLSNLSSLEKGGTYVAVHADGSGTCPFTVKEVLGDDLYRVHWRDYVEWRRSMSRVDKENRPQDWEIGYSAWDAKLRINKRAGSKLRSVNGELSVPEQYKIIKIEDPPKPKRRKEDNDLMPAIEMGESSDSSGSDERPIQPGTLVDIQLMLLKQAQLRVHDTGANEVWIKSRRGHERMTKKAALITLVRDHGLREEAARTILKEAEARGRTGEPAAYFIKYGYGYGSTDLQSGKPGAPTFPPPMVGTEQVGPRTVASIYPQEEFLPVDSMTSQLSDPTIYDPFYTPDPRAMYTAQQAAQSGQKEVFDATMVAGLLKSVRPESKIDSYLGDLMKALDRLFRVLFLFYWHQEDFEERYGQQDLPELEDSLRNAAESLGDVVLFLKEKQVGGGRGMDMAAGVGNTKNESEPSIQEVARN
jgi:hypothetical protein